jgi:hypothetical protein
MILKTAKLSIASGFRKWSIMALILTVGITFCAIGLVSGQEFVDLIRYTAVAFFATNVAEHFIRSLQEGILDTFTRGRKSRG